MKAHGGRKKNEATCEFTILPGVDGKIKRACCSLCAIGRDYDSQDVSKDDFDIEFEISDTELDDQGDLLEPAPRSKKSRKRFNSKKSRHCTNEYNKKQQPFHSLYLTDPDGFSKPPPDFEPAKQAVKYCKAAEACAKLAAEAAQQPTEDLKTKASQAAKEACDAAKDAESSATEAARVAAVASKRQNDDPHSAAAILAASRAAARASEAKAAADRATIAAKNAEEDAKYAAQAMDIKEYQMAAIGKALSDAEAVLSHKPVEERAYASLNDRGRKSFSIACVVLTPAMVADAARFAMKAAQIYYAPSKLWNTSTWYHLGLSLDSIASELARKESNWVCIAELAGEIARVAFPNTTEPCGRQDLSFWWEKKQQGQIVLSANEAGPADSIKIPVDTETPDPVALVDLEDASLMAALTETLVVPDLPIIKRQPPADLTTLEGEATHEKHDVGKPVI